MCFRHRPKYRMGCTPTGPPYPGPDLVVGRGVSGVPCQGPRGGRGGGKGGEGVPCPPPKKSSFTVSTNTTPCQYNAKSVTRTRGSVTTSQSLSPIRWVFCHQNRKSVTNSKVCDQNAEVCDQFESLCPLHYRVSHDGPRV